MPRRALLLFAFIFLGFAPPAQAEFIVTAGSTTVAAGDSGFIDVLLSNEGDPVFLGSFQLKILIEMISGDMHTLRFAPETEQDSSYTSELNYVFTGDSSGPGFLMSSTAKPGDTLIVNDSPGEYDSFFIQDQQPYLLARLEITADMLAGPGRYQIRVVQDADSYFTEDTDVLIPFTSFAGEVTVTSDVPPVPEPASMTLLLTGGGLVWLSARRWRRR